MEKEPPRYRSRRAHALLALAAALVVGLSGATPSLGESQSHAQHRVELPERVVMLHGFGRTQRAMRPLAQHVNEAGFEVHNIGYPSLSATPEELRALVAQRIAECCATDPRPLHFVTHSMGGVVLRDFLAHEAPRGMGRVVMLAPPNSGHELVERWGENGLIRAMLGPTASQLGTDAEDLPGRLGPVDFELGVIAGNRNWNPFALWLFPSEGDGVVTLDSTRLEGMRDHLVVAETHTSIRRDAEVAAQVVHFLRHGQFAREVDSSL